MRKTNFIYLDKYQEKILRDFNNTASKSAMLEMAMYILDSLLDWCGSCFNSKQEEIFYKNLNQAYKILEKVHKSYEENYNV